MALVITKEDAELLHQVREMLEHYDKGGSLTDLLREEEVANALKILVAMWRHLG